jgi:hypothetical protein
MNLDELDRILGKEEPIIPSSGFAASVMEAVRADSAACEPIGFPWRKAMPGVGAAGVVVILVLALGIAAIVRPGWAVTGSELSASQTAPLTAAVEWATRFGTSWMGAAWALALLSLAFGLRVAFPRR